MEDSAPPILYLKGKGDPSSKQESSAFDVRNLGGAGDNVDGNPRVDAPFAWEHYLYKH